MTQTMTNTDVVRRGYQAFNDADGATLTRLFDERASWDTPGHGVTSGLARGRDAVFAQFALLGEETAGTFKAELQAVFEAEDGRVVGLHHSSGVRNGKRLDTDACIVFELENGRVISGREYVYDLQSSDEFWS
jgi:ketosteroid isomerase-like protein